MTLFIHLSRRKGYFTLKLEIFPQSGNTLVLQPALNSPQKKNRSDFSGANFTAFAVKAELDEIKSDTVGNIYGRCIHLRKCTIHSKLLTQDRKSGRVDPDSDWAGGAERLKECWIEFAAALRCQVNWGRSNWQAYTLLEKCASHSLTLRNELSAPPISFKHYEL